MKNLFYLSIFAVLIFTLSTFTIQDAHASTFTATQSGDWNDPATWGGSSPPIAINSGDTVVIPSGITITIPSGVVVTNSGTINNSGTIDNNEFSSFNNSGNVNNYGTINQFGAIINNYNIINNYGIINSRGGAINNGGINNGQMLTPIVINNSPGDHYYPHVSGDWASYTSGLTTRYYNFATHTDAQIPFGSSSEDFLSDISGSKIVFSRVITGDRTAIMVFDASTPTVAPVEIDAASGSNRFGSAIGSNTVAYIDYGLHPNGGGELVIHDLITNRSVQITNDAAFNEGPSVSPDGNVVTWDHCLTLVSNCDIWQAVKNGATWNVSVVAATPYSGITDSNGNLVVYDSIRGTDSDIFWRPVSGGTESHLSMPGFQTEPSIAGNLIIFESRSPTLSDQGDLFIYDLNTKRTYQITNTPLITEYLADITVLPDGKVRVVWTSDENGFNQRSVHAATFTIDNGVINNLCNGIINLGTFTGNPIVYVPCNLVVTSGAGQTLTTGQVSNTITVQQQLTSGTPVNAGTGGISVSLSSTSTGGQFSLLQSPFTPINIVTIPAGSNSATLYYKDTVSGSPTITASSGTLTSAMIFTILAADTTPPIVTLTPSRAPDSNGYYNHPVTFTVTGDDATTGASNPVTCDGIITYYGPDGNSITITGHCTDNAGNTGSTSVIIKYDSTPPKIIAPNNISVISKTSVSPPLGSPTVSDNLDLSPIVNNNAPASFVPGTTNTVTWTATDHAGNSATATQQVIIKTPGNAINDLIILGNSFGANTNVLGNAAALLNDSNPNNDSGSCGKLDAFINQVNANNSLTLSQKTQLIQLANAIKVSIGC